MRTFQLINRVNPESSYTNYKALLVMMRQRSAKQFGNRQETMDKFLDVLDTVDEANYAPVIKNLIMLKQDIMNNTNYSLESIQ